jgi:hypothetical protein
MNKDYKTILIIILSAIFAFLIFGLFIKKEYKSTRSVTINRSQKDVFNYLKYLKNQNNYNKLNLMDPSMKKTYHGIDAMIGFVASWDSELKELGKGEHEITSIVDSSGLVVTELRFIKPFSGKANSILTTDSITENKTNVSWSFESKIEYPMNVILFFANADKSIGKDLEEGLTNLKDILEGNTKEKRKLIHYGLNTDSVKKILTEKYHGKILKITKLQNHKYLFRRMYNINNRVWIPLILVNEELQMDTVFIKNLEIDFNLFNLSKPVSRLRDFQTDTLGNIRLSGSFRFRNYKDSSLTVYRLGLLSDGRIDTESKLFKPLLDFGIKGLESDLDTVSVDSITFDESPSGIF